MPAQTRLRTVAAALTATAGLVTTALVGGVSPAQAAGGLYGKVVFVADGDTIDVNVAKDGTSRPVRVRYIGIQTMELSRYSHTLRKLRGDCWSVDAARHLHGLIDGRRVKLSSRKSTSHSGKNVRPRRHVAVRSGGQWVDTGALQLSAGLALPDLLPDEFSHNLDYMRRAQEAAANGVGMWGNPARCGEGPNQTEPLQVSVNWDAEGNDAANVNGEWVDITNLGAVAVPMGGWWVRDAAYRGTKARGYVIPSGVVVEPGDTLRIHVGRGNDSAKKLYWGLDKNIFANVTDGAKWMGDGAWLFDPDGDLRGWDMYPCRYAC
jgi:endonuclease YncB( thermonuclease family)